jgi:gas vesicle protein
MSETLIGVVIGGLIAWVAPLMTLRFNERKWRFESKLNFLKTERDRLEQLYERNLERFGRGLSEDAYSSEMTAEMFAMMPKEISEIYQKWISDSDKTDIDRKTVYLDLATAMKHDIARRDREIRCLFEE